MPLTPHASPVTLVFWNLTAAGVVAGLLAVLWIAIRRSRRGTPALDAALAFAGLICAEAAIVDVLSVFEAVGRWSVLIAHIVLIATVAGAFLPRGKRPSPGGSRSPRARRWWWAMAPLVALVLASAIRYAPNSGDAMTYHLARVAHWIQNGSTAPYPSLSLRQTIMMPGAEYIVTALLAIAGSDHLAVVPQFVAWLIVGAAAPSLARLWGAPSGAAWLAVPVVMAAPMMVLQGSSTQNDLVAAVTAVAVVAASLPLMHGGRPPRASALILFGFACAAAGLVKATAVIAALPFAVVAACNIARAGLPGPRAAAAVLAIVIPVSLVLPEAARRHTFTRLPSADYVYSASDSWLDRISNQGRILGRHLPMPLVPAGWTESGSGRLRPGMPSRAHEDSAGNPLQIVAGATLLALALFRWRRLPRRARISAVCWLAGWVAIHAILKDNEFLPRLEVPWFALIPVLAGGATGLSLVGTRARLWLALVASGILTLHGAWIAAHNELRPPVARTVGPRESHYFLNGSVVMNQQFEALRIAQQNGCRQIALFMGESGFDYPISRAAMSAGIATRHLLTDDGWACAIYVERLSWGFWKLPRHQVALDSRAWSIAATGPGGPFVYVRRRTP